MDEQRTGIPGKLLAKKILVIEDDPDTLTFLSEALKRAGYAPVPAPDGETGLEKFRAAEPDLVLLDIVLPGISGWDVIRKIKAGIHKRDVPVVMFTARDADTEKMQGYRYGADYYLTKPCEVPRILSVIEKVLLDHL